MNYTYIFLTCNTDLHNFRIKKKGKSAERWGGGQKNPTATFKFELSMYLVCPTIEINICSIPLIIT